MGRADHLPGLWRTGWIDPQVRTERRRTEAPKLKGRERESRQAERECRFGSALPWVALAARSPDNPGLGPLFAWTNMDAPPLLQVPFLSFPHIANSAPLEVVGIVGEVAQAQSLCALPQIPSRSVPTSLKRQGFSV